MSNSKLIVLFEDNHLLALAKPADVPTMGVSAGNPSLLMMAKDYIKNKYGKPGNVYLGVVSRLDALATGVIVFARTSKAAARLSEQLRRGKMEKLYWAIVSGIPKPSEGKLENWLRKDERTQKMQITRTKTAGSKQADLSYRVLAKLGRRSLLEVHLHTGRKHQIRVQLAHFGHPILGDQKYGSKTPFPEGIALHARKLVLQHPVRKSPIVLEAPVPPVWRDFGIGDVEA